MVISDIFAGPFFVYHDSDKENKTSHHNLTRGAAQTYNKQGYAVAVYVNDLGGGRSNAHCKAIRAWFVDIDYKDKQKPDLDELLDLSPLLPSMVVNTRNGYHLYFTAVGSSPGEAWKAQQRALIDFFDGDHKCAHEARGLRAAGFYHMKESDPFMVEIVHELNVSYTPAQMQSCFPLPAEEENTPTVRTKKELPIGDGNIFDKIFSFDTLEILKALSGTEYVNYKQYKFQRMGSGHHNIIVEGKDSGCFINKERKVIGDPRYSGGAIEWLAFYGLNRVEAAKAVCEVMGWQFKR